MSTESPVGRAFSLRRIFFATASVGALIAEAGPDPDTYCCHN
jgi:hypothetical protein